MPDAPSLLELPALLVDLADTVPRELATQAGADGSFSFVEHVWHLADLDEVYAERLDRWLHEERPVLADFAGARAAVERNYLARDPREGARQLLRARTYLSHRFAALTDAQSSRVAVQEGVGERTLAALPGSVLAHDRAHAAELVALLAPLVPGHPALPPLARIAAAGRARSPCGPRDEDASGALDPWLRRVRQLVAARLGTTDTLRVGHVAAQLRMSARTLQRRLERRQLTFACMLEEARQHFALSYVAGSRTSVADIAERLGYADSRAFLRAFKRWTGKSPRALRHGATTSRNALA